MTQEQITRLRALCDADRLPPKQPVIGLRAVFDWAEHLRTELARLWEGTDATPAKSGEVATDAQALHAMLEKSPEDRLNMLKLMRVYADFGTDCINRDHSTKVLLPWSPAKLTLVAPLIRQRFDAPRKTPDCLHRCSGGRQKTRDDGQRD